jgi:hypothetical protein
MSRAGMRAAAAHGRALPRYGSQEEAERALFAHRDVLLDQFRAVAPNSASFRFDLTPESLKILERWYFELHERAAFGEIGLNRETFERCIAMYFGEVIVKNHAEFKWAVREFAFEPGRYEIGVVRGTLAVMLTRFSDVHARPSNKKRESIWREYRRWVS